jgi:hypothetical protein
VPCMGGAASTGGPRASRRRHKKVTGSWGLDGLLVLRCVLRGVEEEEHSTEWLQKAVGCDQQGPWGDRQLLQTADGGAQSLSRPHVGIVQSRPRVSSQPS